MDRAGRVRKIGKKIGKRYEPQSGDLVCAEQACAADEGMDALGGDTEARIIGAARFRERDVPSGGGLGRGGR